MYGEKGFLDNLYLSAVFPNLIAILGGTINVFVDGILVGQKLGDLGIAAVNQSLAVYLLLCTLGSLIGSGASALSSQALGNHDREKCNRYFSLAIEMAIVMGGIFCIFGCLLSPTAALLLAGQDSAHLVETYIKITFLGGVFKIFLYLPFNYLRLIGKTSQSAFAMLLMTVLNIGLDFLFMFYFDWGIAGAAWASSLATIIACIISCMMLFTAKDAFSFSLCLPKKKEIREIIHRGSPMAANNLFSAFRIIFLNYIMNFMGGSSLVALFAITNNVNEFSICVQNGVPQAGTCMFGICYGERDVRSIKNLLRLQIKFGLLLGGGLAAVITIFADQIGKLFGSDQDVRFALFCYAISLVIGMINNVMIYYYYAMMQSVISNIITFLRIFGAVVLSILALIPFKNMIWLFYPLSEIITLVIWGIGVLLFQWKKKQKWDIYLLEDLAVDESRCTNFQVECNVEKICERSEKISDFCEENDFTPEQTMTVSLALEELMIIMAEKSMNNQGFLDVRILRTNQGAILRIRSKGKHFNPLEFAEHDLDYLGVGMISKMTKRTEYQTTLGLNTLVVEI